MMTISIRIVCAVFVALAQTEGSLNAQEFEKKQAEVLKKVNALVKSGDSIIPEKVAGNLEELAKEKDFEVNAFRAYLKAAGLFDPKFEGDKPSVVPDLLAVTPKERTILAGKYMLAEQVFAWRVIDPKFEYFIAPEERDQFKIKLRRFQIEAAIDALEFAHREKKTGKVFAGLEYAAGGENVIKELKAVLKRLPQEKK